MFGPDRRHRYELAFEEFDALLGTDDAEFAHAMVLAPRNWSNLVIGLHITRHSIAPRL
jgi:hypothetical protein